MESCSSALQWQLHHQAVVAAEMRIISVITQFGTAQSNSKDHFTPGNAFYAFYVQRGWHKVDRGQIQAREGKMK